MPWWRWTSAVALAAMIGSFVWAAGEASLGDGLRQLIAHRWGIVTLIDLYLGLIVFAAIVYLLERNALVTAFWAILLALLGNFATLLYVVVRAGRIQVLIRALAVTAADRAAGSSPPR